MIALLPARGGPSQDQLRYRHAVGSPRQTLIGATLRRPDRARAVRHPRGDLPVLRGARRGTSGRQLVHFLLAFTVPLLLAPERFLLWGTPVQPART